MREMLQERETATHRARLLPRQRTLTQRQQLLSWPEVPATRGTEHLSVPSPSPTALLPP